MSAGVGFWRLFLLLGWLVLAHPPPLPSCKSSTQPHAPHHAVLTRHSLPTRKPALNKRRGRFILAQIQMFLFNCFSKIPCHCTKLISISSNSHSVLEIMGNTHGMRFQFLLHLNLNTYTWLVTMIIISPFIECFLML